MKPPLDIVISRLDDAERVRRSHAEAIVELQRVPLVGAIILASIELEDGAETPIAHRLGRVPRFVTASLVRGAVTTGRIDDIRTTSYDRSRFLVLQANGYGATITVDLMVVP